MRRFSGTELMSSVWWSWQLADGVPRGVGALSRAGSADVLLLSLVSVSLGSGVDRSVFQKALSWTSSVVITCGSRDPLFSPSRLNKAV